MWRCVSARAWQGAARAGQVRTFMPTEGFENCGNATLVAARSVPNLVPPGAVSASVLTLNLTTATYLELQFNEFGKCVAPLPYPIRAASDERARTSPRPAGEERAGQRCARLDGRSVCGPLRLAQQCSACEAAAWSNCSACCAREWAGPLVAALLQAGAAEVGKALRARAAPARSLQGLRDAIARADRAESEKVRSAKAPGRAGTGATWRWTACWPPSATATATPWWAT